MSEVKGRANWGGVVVQVFPLVYEQIYIRKLSSKSLLLACDRSLVSTPYLLFKQKLCACCGRVSRRAGVAGSLPGGVTGDLLPLRHLLHRGLYLLNASYTLPSLKYRLHCLKYELQTCFKLIKVGFHCYTY